MIKNMGSADRLIRIGLAVIIAVLIITGVVVGVAAIILGILAAVFVLTSVVSFCPLYYPFGMKTCKRDGAANPGRASERL